MAQTMINFRMDLDDKISLEAVCEKLGMSVSTAFKIFAKKMIREHAQKGNCVLFSTHVLDTAEELCDKVIIIRKGKVVCFDTVENLKNKYGGASLEDSYLNIVGDIDEK